VPAGVDHLALLRGINVGGKNLVKMADLRAAFEAMGFVGVATYIQSGNVLFRGPRARRAELSARIESELSRRFGIELKVVVLTAAEMRRVVEGAPPGFGAASHLSDVIFLRPPMTAKRAFALVELRDGIDAAWEGKAVLYFSRVASRASGSRLSRLAARPEYKEMTVRSWSTTTKLHARLAERSAQHP
jgi:uncharacterized protein (DUF1697 family)